jgi:hypothetical protein
MSALGWGDVLLYHMGIGLVLIVWSAVVGNSARETFKSIDEFSRHLGFLFLWPLVLVYELLYLWRQKRWEKEMSNDE